MDAAREDRLERLHERALALPAERRAAFLLEACGGDVQLHEALSTLVTHAGDAEGFLDRVAGPAVARVAGRLFGADFPDSDPADDARVGQRVAHFHIVGKLGSGGMGRVYEARDLLLDRPVALKFLPRHLGGDTAAKARFVHEAKAASALDHPSICAVHEIGETDEGELFIAMAHCDGVTLKQRIAGGPVPVAEALACAAQVAEGLQRAHEAGIVHRDMKPANVMVTTSGRVQIVDFGVAKMAGADLTRDGSTVGTVAYMSPEQTRGATLDARTDIWSLGAVLYEMLAGRRAFPGESDESLIYGIRHDEPLPLRRAVAGIPRGVAALVHRCLAKDPRRRYQDAGELLADLRTLQAGGTVRRPLDASRWTRLGLGALAASLLLFAASRLARPATRVESLAVLPVRALSGDSVQRGFADGMADLLIGQLSQLSALRRVISRASMAQYEDTRKTPRQIGRELGVDALVELSVSRKGQEVRVDATLLDADAGAVLWSRSFERPMRDVLSLQRDVAQAIARELGLQLTPREEAQLVVAAPSVNPEAFALYLRSARTSDVREGARLLEQAVATDSTFALAYARLAHTHIMVSRDKAKAERAIERALALDPGSSEGFDALGLLRMWMYQDWAGAESAFRRAIALNPHNSLAHHELGQLFMRLGRCDEAIDQEERAVLENPGGAHYQSGLAEVYLYCRQYDRAILDFERNLPLVRDSASTYFLLGDAYYYKGDYATSLAMHQKSSAPDPGWVNAALGDDRPARAQIAELSARWARGESNAFTAWNLARLHTSLREPEEAITWLERSHAAGYGIVVSLKAHPHFDPLRSNPRFQALLQKLNLAE